MTTQINEQEMQQKEMQQKYMEFQYLQQQIEQLNQHLELLIQQNEELEISINAVNELEKTPINNEILAPIANGIFLKAKLQDNHKLIVNIGSNTTVEKTIPEVVQLLEEQKKEISQGMAETDALMQEISTQALKMYQALETKQK